MANPYINLYISRRHSNYKKSIQSLLSEFQVSTYITDARLRPEKGNPIYAPLSIVIFTETDGNREPLEQWLTWVTKNLRNTSDKIFMVLFDGTKEKATEYNEIDEKMKVECFCYTIDDTLDAQNIRDRISSYLTDNF